MSDNIWNLLLGGGGGVALWKVVEIWILPRKEKKEFERQLRDELWDRVKNLEGRIDEQTRMILDVMKENAALKVENSLLHEEIESLKKHEGSV